MTPAELSIKEILEKLDPFDWKDTWKGWNDEAKWKKLCARLTEIFIEIPNTNNPDARHHELVCKVAGILHLANSFEWKE